MVVGIEYMLSVDDDWVRESPWSSLSVDLRNRSHERK